MIAISLPPTTTYVFALHTRYPLHTNSSQTLSADSARYILEARAGRFLQAMIVSISMAQRRLLTFIATIFFVTSVYLCTTRLFTNSLTRESIHPGYAPDTSSSDSNIQLGTPFDDTDPADNDNLPEIDMSNVELSRADNRMSYGRFKRPLYDDIQLVGSLPDEFVPTLKNRRRLIIFGDIHGMLEPFNALLEKAEYDGSRDHVVTVGDMVNKGTNSPGVISRLMELGASAVRGNHEDRVLVSWAAQGLQRGLESSLADADAEKHRGEHEDLTTARALNDEQRKWLASLPVILTIEPLGIHIAHAGLVPNVDLEEQDPWAVMHMRSFKYPRAEFRDQEIARKKKLEEKKKEEERKKEEEKKKKEEEEKAKQAEEEKKQEEEKKKFEEERKKQEEEDRKKQEATATEAGEPTARRARARARARVRREVSASSVDSNGQQHLFDHDVLLPIESHDGEPWSDLWNDAQQKLSPTQRRTVVYGHDSKAGYKEGDYTLGIDSGCVGGNSLSAIIIEASEGGFTHLTVQVACQEG